MNIHSTAIIEKGASIGDGVTIGPYSVIGGNAKIEKNVKIHSHVCISGDTIIGESTEIFPFTAIGFKPQDLKYKGEKSQVLIGKNNVIREYVTIHLGTCGDKMKTVIGDNNLFMIGVHIAHDCIIGNNNVFANNATLAGHIEVEDNVILGGMSAYHQFIKIGKGAIVGGGSIVVKNVIPYAAISSVRAYMSGLNLIGLKRKGISRDVIKQLLILYRELFVDRAEALSTVAKTMINDYKDNELAQEIINFIISSQRALCLPRGMDED